MADEVAAVPKSAISDWIDRTLVPRNAALIIVGDLDLGEAEAAARGTFAGWSESPGPVAPPPPATPDAPSPPGLLIGGTNVLVTARPGASQVELHLACPLPPSTGPETATYEVSAQILSMGLRGRLREETGSTYGVSSGDFVLRGGSSVLQVQANVENGRILLALETMCDLWAGIAARGVDPADVRAARDDWARGRLVGYETSAGIASALAWAWNLGWPLTWPDDAPRYTMSVTPDDVTAALRTCARHQTLALTGDEAVIRKAIADLRAGVATGSAPRQ
jgi:zinc protease